MSASPSPAPVERAPYTASTLLIHLWAVGAMADYMFYAPFQVFIKPVFTTVYGLNPVLIGWALMATRLLDGFLDPLIGTLSDNTHTRWGRRRPFLLVSVILGALLLTAVWVASPTWGSTALFIHLIVTSSVLFVSWGTYSMNHVALGYELSDDYYLRTKVIAVRSFYAALAAMGGGWLYWIALRPGFGSELNGVRWVSVGMGVVALAAASVTIFTGRERFENARKPHVNLWHAIRTTMRNRPFVVLLLLRIAQTFGASLFGQVSFFIGVYYVCRGDKALNSTFSGYNGFVGFGLSFLMIPLAAGLSRRVGKRTGIVVGQSLALCAACAGPFVFRPGWPYLMWMSSVFFVIVGSPWGLFAQAIMPDICDIDELHSGERREGLYAAVNSFVNKLENSICILLGGYLLEFSGFSTKLAQQNLPQPDAVLERLCWLGFTPNIVFAAIALVVALFLPINHQLMAEVRAKLDARRQLAAAAAVPV